MQWLMTWWSEMGTLSQVFLCAAVPATIIMLIQTIMMLFGMGFGGDADSDLDADGDVDGDMDGDFDGDDLDGDFDYDADPGLRIFTVRGLVAFFAIGGWAGVAAMAGGLKPAVSALIAFLAGGAALVFAALVVKWALRMQEGGNINPVNAVAHTGTVYIPIPPNRTSTGRVTLLLQERYVEMDAVTDMDFTLKTGTSVQVTGVMGGNCLVVRPRMTERISEQ